MIDEPDGLEQLLAGVGVGDAGLVEDHLTLGDTGLPDEGVAGGDGVHGVPALVDGWPDRTTDHLAAGQEAVVEEGAA